MICREPGYEDKIMNPDSDWYNDKPSVGGYYCPLPIFPSAEEECAGLRTAQKKPFPALSILKKIYQK